MFCLLFLLFLLKASEVTCDQICNCEEITLLKDIIQQNILDQKLETSRLFAKIRRLEVTQNVKTALVEAKEMENAATFEKMEKMYKDMGTLFKDMDSMSKNMDRMSTDMERMHKDISSKLNHSVNTKSHGSVSIIKMGFKAEKQKRIELSSKLESQLSNITETLNAHKKETKKRVEQCKSNINSLKDVFEQDVNSTLSVLQEQIYMNHESVSFELVKVKQHLDKNDVMISRLDPQTFRSDFDGGWAQWGAWSSCSVTCGGGIRQKTRTCTYPEPSLFGRQCEGKSRMEQDCNSNTCPGTLCIDDEAVDCARMDELFDICQDQDQASLVCPKFCNLCLSVDGNWAQWSAWSNCDVTCDSGTQTRTRTCTDPAPKFGGLDCDGSSSETKHCVKKACPIHGGWSPWSPWGSCSVTCDIGMQRRHRSCSNPSPTWDGNRCYGDGREDRICMAPACADGTWSNWGTWGTCSESCGGGVKSRRRSCTNPKPSILGTGCEGSSEQVVMCSKNTCDDHKVAFLATGSTSETQKTVIKFPSIRYNFGNSYSSSTGRFTCKIAGIYNFAVTLTKPRRDIDLIVAYLRINGADILKLESDPSDIGNIDYGSYSLSVAGNVHLNTNDYVDVFAVPNYFYSNINTAFTGVLVIPDN